MTGSNLGTATLPDGGRIDFAALRAERLRRCLAEMERRGVDVLLLGREPNARYVSGARRLWFAGTRPFAPGCVVVRSTGHVHLMTAFDEGIPEEIARERLFAFTWNPANLVTVLQGIPGVAAAATVGVDCMTPLFQQLLPVAIPNGELVDGEDLVRSVRMRKAPDEVRCLRTAVSIAEAATWAAVTHLRPGVRERELLGVFDERMASFGVTTPSMEGTFCVLDPATDGRPGGRRLASERTIGDGELVAVSSGVLYAGYEGVVGRTWWASRRGVPTGEHRALYDSWRAVVDAVIERCRAGATGADLRKAHEGTGEPLPGFPIAYSVGLGYEAPIAGAALGADFDARWVLEPGMTLVVQARIAGRRGAFHGAETVLVTDDAPEVLTTLGHGPLAAAPPG